MLAGRRGHGAGRYNLQAQQAMIAQEAYDLHTLIFVICYAIFVVVFGAMIYSIIKHRKAVGHNAEQFHENVKVEIAWSIIPFLILTGMVYPATKTVMPMKDAASTHKPIKVTGQLREWGRDYLLEDVGFNRSCAAQRGQNDGNSGAGSRRAVHPNDLFQHHPALCSTRVWLNPVFMKA